MTFEDYELSLNLDLEQIDDRYILDVARNAWNAAIMASIEQLSEGYWYWNVDKEDAVKQEQYTQGEYCMLPEDDIKKLLTS